MSSFDRNHDARVRAAVFEWLSGQVARHGDVLPRNVIAGGLEVDGQRVPLVGPQGIFKPRILDVPTLVHGLQALEGERIALRRSASDRPNPELLERRWGEFREEAARAG